MPNQYLMPIASLFLISILWHRCNEPSGGEWSGERPFFIKDVHFMYVAAILFWVSGFVAVIVSKAMDFKMVHLLMKLSKTTQTSVTALRPVIKSLNRATVSLMPLETVNPNHSTVVLNQKHRTTKQKQYKWEERLTGRSLRVCSPKQRAECVWRFYSVSAG